MHKLMTKALSGSACSSLLTGHSGSYTRFFRGCKVVVHVTSMAGNNPRSGICKIEREEEVARGKWLALNNYHWVDHTSRRRVWEVVSRTTRGTLEQDSVAVTAVLHKPGQPSALVLIKQFRPPLRTYTIELPAGLVDAGETADIAALRELKEETGFSGVITGIGRSVALDPGISNSLMKIVTVKIDGESAENKDVASVCGVDGEHIEVLLVPLSCIQDYLTDFAAKGMIIDSRVEALALGLSVSLC
ncbi:ADP-sugar pyrophosphatase-like [Panulirus ornatus]|uniref:ADP-sugar pyrophosphatase-like n=1 Tax=Panulirus ornatus TaxID=150431 RepID=UPI003A83C209